MATPNYQDDSGKACVPSLINGKPIVQPSATSFPVYSAAKQQIVHYAQTASVDLATEAVKSAAEAFKTYKKTSVVERQRLLLRAADLFDQKVDEASSRQMTETSADKTWATFNAKHMATCCREAAGVLEAAVTGQIMPSQTGFHSMAFKEPVGTVLLIMPWNGALALSSRGIASALAAGCTVVLKASELCPWTHYLVAETFLEAGFPEGSVNYVVAERSAGPEVTEAIIAHPKLAKIEFIGSAVVGRAIGLVAAKHLKPIVMELGDQSPLIVLDDADLKKAAELAVRGGMIHHGQVCFSTERIIVQSVVKDRFYGFLKEVMAATPSAGFAATNAFADKGKAAIDDAIQRGAKLLCGSSEQTGPASLAPSVLVGLDPDCHLSKNEAFAPTMFVTVVDTDQQAIDEANSREGGLSAAVFTSSYERGLNMSRELEFGQVQINAPTSYAEPTGPISGWKGSGWGSHAGRYGIELFLQHKTVSFAPTAGNSDTSQKDYHSMA